jgi:hypothetical protein
MTETEAEWLPAGVREAREAAYPDLCSKTVPGIYGVPTWCQLPVGHDADCSPKAIPHNIEYGREHDGYSHMGIPPGCDACRKEREAARFAAHDQDAAEGEA